MNIKVHIQGNFVLLCFLIFFSSCISIQKIPSAKKDDGYSSLNEEQKKSIHDFTIENKNNSTRDIQWINAKQLKEIAKTNDKKLWVIVWATWCPHSINLIENKLNTYSEMFKSSITSVLIAQNINIEYQTKMLDKISYKNPLYILNSNEYGTNEDSKAVKFLNEFNIDYKQILKSTPANLLLNNKGEILKIKYGENITEEFFN